MIDPFPRVNMGSNEIPEKKEEKFSHLRNKQTNKQTNKNKNKNKKITSNCPLSIPPKEDSIA